MVGGRSGKPVGYFHAQRIQRGLFRRLNKKLFKDVVGEVGTRKE
jgi:hypothetical protein